RTSRLVIFKTTRLYNLAVMYDRSIAVSTAIAAHRARAHQTSSQARGCATADHPPLPESRRLGLARVAQGEVHERKDTSMHLLWALIIGLVIGALAKLVIA